MPVDVQTYAGYHYGDGCALWSGIERIDDGDFRACGGVCHYDGDVCRGEALNEGKKTSMSKKTTMRVMKTKQKMTWTTRKMMMTMTIWTMTSFFSVTVRRI